MFPTQTITQYHFNGQKPDEKVLLILHRHWFDILSQFILIFFLILIFFGSFGLYFVSFNFSNNPNYRNLLLFGQNSFFLFIWLAFFVIWIDYYFDVWIVTNRRIVNIEQNGLFNRKTSELELEKIQDVTTDVKGIIPTFFNYGDIQVQTAGEQEKFLFHNIANPYQVKDLIMNLQKKFEQQENIEFTEMLSKKIHHEDIG